MKLFIDSLGFVIPLEGGIKRKRNANRKRKRKRKFLMEKFKIKQKKERETCKNRQLKQVHDRNKFGKMMIFRKRCK